MRHDVRDVFAERFSQLIKPGETQKEFSERIGLVRNTITQYINKNRIPDSEILGHICDVCNVSADWLLGLSDTKRPEAGLRSAAEYTGLSEKSIEALKRLSEQAKEILNAIFDNKVYEQQFSEMLEYMDEERKEACLNRAFPVGQEKIKYFEVYSLLVERRAEMIARHLAFDYNKEKYQQTIQKAEEDSENGES